MSKSIDSVNGARAAGARALVESKNRLDDILESWVGSRAFEHGDQIKVADAELHTAVMGFWWRMRPHLDSKDVWESVEKCDTVDEERIWAGVHPETGEQIELKGLADLAGWLDKTIEIEEDSPGPNRASQTSTVATQLRLPSGAAIESAQLLCKLFSQADIAPDVDLDKAEDATGEYEQILEGNNANN